MVLLKGLRAKDLDISYTRANVAADNTIKDRLLSTEKTRQLLVEAQQADIELYDWAKRELFESYRREYGPALEADVSAYQKSLPGSFNLWNLTLSHTTGSTSQWFGSFKKAGLRACRRSAVERPDGGSSERSLVLSSGFRRRSRAMALGRAAQVSASDLLLLKPPRWQRRRLCAATATPAASTREASAAPGVDARL